ncbi:amino acid ABC transporter permease [Brucepastera parasyntrophica]|nr:amino acid ABC transporter permease [Brucepastera parasyntrophica]ULQ61217.1 amino acid ABC transporter permease [Brucepastera parasyntrophica]
MQKLLPQLAKGSLVSMQIFFLTLLFALPLALPVAFGRMSKKRIIQVPVNIYLLIMRGTPLILQLIFVYFAPYYIFRVSYDRFVAVIIAYVINYAAYFAEIYRGGIESIPVGQYEAAKVLGFTKSQTFFRIILPQVIKRIIPSTANEVITLVKDTALAQTIGVAELFRVAQNASARQFSTVPIFIAGVFYFVMNWIVSTVFTRAEKKLSYYR